MCTAVCPHAHNLADRGDIFTTNNEQSPWYGCEHLFLLRIYPLNCVLQYQVRKLIPASQHADQFPSIAKYNEQLLCDREERESLRSAFERESDVRFVRAVRDLTVGQI